MAVIVPQPKQEIAAETFGAPVANLLNALMYPTWRAVTLGPGVTIWGTLTPQVSQAGTLVAFSGTLGVPVSSPTNTLLFTFPSGVTFTSGRNLLCIAQQGPTPCWVDTAGNAVRLGAAYSGGGWLSIDGQFQYL